MLENERLKQSIPSWFLWGPNVSILKKRVKEYLSNDFDFSYHYFASCSNVVQQEIFTLLDEKIFRIQYHNTLLVLKDKDDRTNKATIQDFKIEFFVSYGDAGGTYNRPLILGIDELSFFINRRLSDSITQSEGFPKLSFVSERSLNDDFISKGRAILRNFFPDYDGSLFNVLDFEKELTESFALAGNSLAFLIRFQERVRLELNVAKNDNFESKLIVYPRFNNAIAEAANQIYNLWERIVFLINEFFPLKNGTKSGQNPPSFNKYFGTKNRDFKEESAFRTQTFKWFLERLDEQHKRLSNLRHPSVHYNKMGKIKGVRSAQFVLDSLERGDFANDFLKMKNEIAFLYNELGQVDTAVRNALSLVEEWALISKDQNTNKPNQEKSN